MKASSLGLLIRNSMGTKTEVLTEDDTDYLRVRSELTATQLNQLQTLAGSTGFKLEARGEGGDVFLAVVPDPEKEVRV
jgi:hypothetical protein